VIDPINVDQLRDAVRAWSARSPFAWDKRSRRRLARTGTRGRRSSRRVALLLLRASSSPFHLDLPSPAVARAAVLLEQVVG
jgi:hypothetical protein